MKKLLIIIGITVAVITTLIIFKNISGSSVWVWELSNKGTWLLPLVFFAALLDSIHPCSFSILFITIAFLFSMQMTRGKILMIGGTYVLGIFMAYLLIGLGIFQVLHLFNTPHFMGKLGAAVLVIFGVLNIVNYLFPQFPIRLRIPESAHSSMSRLIDKASFPAAFGLGALVGVCQFPCMGGPYLMVIGLLKDQVTYIKGLSYLLMYNIILIIPLLVVLLISADKVLIEKAQKLNQQNRSVMKIGGGVAMIILGIIIYTI